MSMVSAPVSVSQGQQFPGVARSMKTKRFQNSELISTIQGSIAFAVIQKLSINPGLASSFPWLSSEAKKWQQYRFHSLIFRYVTRTATATVGSVILSPDYNPKEQVPTTEAQATNTQDAVEGSPWTNIICRLDPRAMFGLGPRKQIRSTNIAGDLNNYDCGRLFVCAVGEVGAADIGKLWVDYDVELFVPQNSPESDTGPAATCLYSMNADVVCPTGVPTNVIDRVIYDPLGFGTPVAGIFTPAAGTYRITVTSDVTDAKAESFQCVLQFIRAGVVISSNTTVNSIDAGGRRAATHDNVVTLDGTQTFAVSYTLIGLTGGMTVLAANMRMVVTLA
jgi:hypothetical protein